MHSLKRYFSVVYGRLWRKLKYYKLPHEKEKVIALYKEKISKIEDQQAM